MRTLALTALLLAGCQATAPVAAPAANSVQVAGPAVPSAAPVSPALVSDNVPAGAFDFFEDFEHGTARWQLPTPGDLGWRLLKAHTCTGDYSLLLGKDAQQPFTGSASDSYVTLTDGLDLTKARKPLLKYDVLGQAMPDGAVAMTVEVRPKGGDWQPLGETRVADHNFSLSYVSPLIGWAGQKLDLRFHGTIKAVQEPSKGLYLDQIAVIEAVD